MNRRATLRLRLGQHAWWIVVAGALAAWVIVPSWHGWLRGNGDTSREREGTAEVAAPSAEGEALIDESSSVAPQRTTEPDSETATPDAVQAVDGSTFLGWEEPLANQPVRLTMVDESDPASTPTLEVVLISDESGKFSWSLPATRGVQRIDARTADANVACVGDSVRLVQGASSRSLRVHCFPRDCVIEGLVRGKGGAVVADARITDTLLSTATTTSGDGRFRLEVSSARDREVEFTVTADGYMEQPVWARTAGPGSVSRLTITLLPSARIRGRVVDLAGLPLAGARVRAVGENRTAALSAEDGAFVLDHLDPRRGRHLLIAQRDGYVEARLELLATGRELETPDLVLTRGCRLTGCVVDSSGRPLPGVTLRLGVGQLVYDRLEAISDEDGAFVFPILPSGSQRIFACRSDLAPVQVELADVERSSPLRIRMEASHRLAGVVRDDACRPVVGVRVSVRHRDEVLPSWTKTGSNGAFRLDGLPGDEVTLDLFASGYLRASVRVTKVDRDDLELVLPVAGRIAGQVVDRLTGSPIADFTVRFVAADRQATGPRATGYAKGWSQEGRRFVGTNGRWDSGNAGLQVGSVLGIEILADGYVPERWDQVIEVDPPPESGIRRLHRGACVRGQLLGAEGGPVAGARVAALDADRIASGSSDDASADATAFTDSNGKFQLEAVGAGVRLLRIVTAQGSSATDGPFDVPNAGYVDRIVRLGADSRVDGVLLTAAGLPLARETIVVEGVDNRSDSSRHREATTDSMGRFSFEGLEPGSYVVSHRVRRDELQVTMRRQEIVVAPHDGTRVTLQPTGTCSIRGSVRWSGSRALPNVVPIVVRSVDHEGGEGSRGVEIGAIAERGVFEIDGLEAGRYSVTAATTVDDIPAIGSVTVEVSATPATVEIELRVAAIRR